MNPLLAERARRRNGAEVIGGDITSVTSRPQEIFDGLHVVFFDSRSLRLAIERAPGSGSI